jgi:hypothetical protein
MNIEHLTNELFHQALADYFYLMNRGYPEKGSLKLTGDRYKLATDFRTLLYRGVTSVEKSLKRCARLVDFPRDSLIVDGYNVLFTLLNYRLGRLVFISADNICRDTGSLFGKIRNEKLFGECASLLVDYLKDQKFPEIVIYLDEPVSFSRKHKHILGLELRKHNIEGRVELVHSADQALLLHSSGTIATSDSNVLDHSENPLFDLPRKILESKFNPVLFNLYNLLIGGKGEN